MGDFFLFIGLPYIALFSLVVVSIYRFKTRESGISSLSSQFLEKEKLFWGSIAWHVGITIVLLGHIIAFSMPSFVQALVSNLVILYSLEIIGLSASLFAFIGLIILFVRRLRISRIQQVTSVMDLVILSLLTLQILFGILTAIFYRWGLSWSSATLIPYVWSIFTFQPDLTYVSSMPHIVKAHIIFAWLFLLLIPFSRLIHFLALPFEYLFRLPQIVIWNAKLQEENASSAELKAASRRHFLKSTVGITGGLILLLAGVAEKTLFFFKGPALSEKERAELLEEKIHKMKAAVKQQSLEYERLKSKHIFIANLKDLKENEGIYFVDYEMRTGFVFKGDDGLPLVYSAKCPHLGCTLINKVNDGQLLCPCHISHFDARTGDYIDGPVRKPLDKIKYVVKDKAGQIVSNIDEKKIAEYKIYITKEKSA